MLGGMNDSVGPLLTIGAAARELGLSIDTLRYYEKLRLLPRAARQGGRRVYRPQDIERIGFLLKLRATGMPLARIHEYGRLYRQGDATIAERRRLLVDHARTIAAQQDELERALALVHQKIARLDAEAAALPAGAPRHRQSKRLR